MASCRTKNISRRKPVARRKTTRRPSTVTKKKTVAKKPTAKKTTKSNTFYVVDANGKLTNLKIVAK